MDPEFPLPESEDKLFKEANTDYRFNAMIQSGMNKFVLFSEAYKLSAKKLFEQLDGSATNANFIVYPLIFVNRQFLELRLKEIISGLNFVIDHKFEFPNGHDLLFLWNRYLNLVTKVGPNQAPEKDVLINTENLIKEFNDIDPRSFSFRYPVDTTTDRKPSLTITNIDLENFQLTMEKLYNVLDIQSEIVFYLVDQTEEYIQHMELYYHQEIQSYYY